MYVGLAAAAGLDWATVQGADEAALERRLLAAPEQPRDHVQPDYGRLHQELRHKGMTIADAILDRIMQRNHRFTLTGDSLRAERPKTSGKEKNIDLS
jgi:transposase